MSTLTIPEGLGITIPEIICNKEQLYIGNLKHYFKVVFNNAKNNNNPYHNFRHMFHVLWLCYDAGKYYKLGDRPFRNLLIAALFHDFDHPGRTGNDDLNVEIAIRGLRKNLYPAMDGPWIEGISEIIRTTQFPYPSNSSTNLPLVSQILRDADASQALSIAWIQQIIFGLSVEMSKTPVEVFEIQKEFLSDLSFTTQWAREKFPQSVINAKIKEAEDFKDLLD